MEFSTEAYNYNTLSDDNPRNLIIMCTTQGVAVQQDGRGKQRLLHHKLASTGEIHRHWLETERSDHTIGGPQRSDHTSEVIGVKAMGTRFNALMTIQVPLKQFETPAQKAARDQFERRAEEEQARVEKEKREQFWQKVLLCLLSPLLLVLSPLLLLCAPCLCFYLCCMGGHRQVKWGAGQEYDWDCDCNGESSSEMNDACFVNCIMSRSCSSPRACEEAVDGVSNAARVSQGSEYDVWSGLSIGSADLVRHSSEHVTVTVVMYNTVAGGTPSEADVMAAIDDLETLYESCSACGHLVDSTFDFMKVDLTAQVVGDIASIV